jgi:hypothetical protein
MPGREKSTNEMNGKSGNLNDCLINTTYAQYQGKSSEYIPKDELVVVFDADMCAEPNFFLKVLEVMCDDDVALCLTPQAFTNVNPKADIFNNINQQFWEYVLPGCDAAGYIACTGNLPWLGMIVILWHAACMRGHKLLTCHHLK